MGGVPTENPSAGLLQRLSSGRRDLEVALVSAEKVAGLGDVMDKEEGQEVRFVDPLWSRNACALSNSGHVERSHISRHDAARQLPRSSHLSPGPAPAARNRTRAFRVTADGWTSSCVRSEASLIGPAVGDGGRCRVANLT